MASDSAIDVLTNIARAMVVAEDYASIEDALQGMALAEVRRKITTYRRRIRDLERKYGVDFETFGRRLVGRATPDEEDDWLAWRSALGMLEDWQKTLERLSEHTRN